MPVEFGIQQGEAVPIIASSTQRARIPRGLVITELVCRMHGSLVNVEATNDIATTQRGDFFGLINSFRIKRGGDIILDIDGPAIPWLQWHLTGRMPWDRSRELGIGTAQPDADGLPFDVVFRIPFYALGTAQPRISSLDGRVNLSKLEVEVDFGTAAQVDTTATGITSGAEIQINAAHHVNPANPVGGYFLPEIRRRIETISAANTRFQLIQESRHWLRSILIGQVVDTVEAGSIINSISWRSGQRSMISNIEASTYRDWQQQVLGLNRGTRMSAKTAGVNTVDLAEEDFYAGGELVSPDSNEEAWVYVNPLVDGNIADMFPAGAVAEHILELDVNAPGTTNQLHLYPMLLRQSQNDA